jgi:hypothetical protein
LTGGIRAVRILAFSRRIALTLVVSARIPDGLVVGVDSLSTVGGALQAVVNAKVKCKQCGADNDITNLQLPPLQFPVSTKPNAQKLFKFKGKYAVACFGNAFVNQKSMQAQIRALESHMGEVSNVDTVAEKFLLFFEKQLQQEIKDMSKLPNNAILFGFQICGTDADEATKTWALHIGKQSTKKAESQFGTTMSGDVALVAKLLEATGGLPQLQPNFQSFSLGDAVEFVQFLIRFVADYQRFSNMIPTVGGEIDIAIVTNYSGFTWIHQKPLAKMMEVRDL